jgi:hypothetical protein
MHFWALARRPSIHAPPACGHRVLRRVAGSIIVNRCGHAPREADPTVNKEPSCITMNVRSEAVGC